MKRHLLTIVGVALLAVLALSAMGCFDFLEEIWVNPDNSCRLTWNIAVSEAILANDPQLLENMRRMHYMAQRRLNGLRGVRKTFLQEYSDRGLRHFSYDIDLDSVFYVTEVHEVLAEQAPLHRQGVSPTFERLMNGDLQFTQVLASGRPHFAYTENAPAPWDHDLFQEYNETRNAAEAIIPAILADKYVTVRLHAPKIGLTNGRLNRKRNTVEWKVSLAQLAAGNPVFDKLQARVEKTLGYQFWFGIVLPLIVLAFAIPALIVGRKKAKA
ncbi:MAG: hypothetical protein DRH70_01525 [Candidatus Coatesbacteria bacterium]|nr:MAG: hypothetical protein DRH70_01525 [Candidatus Coatesbacteria bacterium]